MNSDLRRSAAAGVKWTGLSSALTAFLQVLQVLVLARILAPEAFGLVAMVMVLIGLGQVFGQMGLVQAVIQRPNPATDELVSLYWLNWAASIAVFVVAVLAAPFAAWLYGEGEVRWLLIGASAVFLIQPFGDLYRAMLEKQLRFRPLAIIDIAAAVVALIVAVVTALAGADAWSLVYAQVASVVVRSAVLAGVGKNYFSPRAHFARRDLDGYLSFGLYRVGAMTLNYLSSRVDQLLIGVLLGPQALGYYSMAFNLVMRPVQQINSVIMRVAFPLLSRIQEDTARIDRAYFGIIAIVAVINAPILFGVAGLAAPLVTVVLGDSWQPMIPVLQLLSVFAFLRVLGNTGGSMVLARGRADKTFTWNALVSLLVPATVAAAATTGELTTVAAVLLLLQTVLFFLWYPMMVKPLLGSSLKKYLLAPAAPLISAGIPALALHLLQLNGLPIGSVAALVAAALAGLAAYAGLYRLLGDTDDRAVLQELLRVMIRRDAPARQQAGGDA